MNLKGKRGDFFKLSVILHYPYVIKAGFIKSSLNVKFGVT